MVVYDILKDLHVSLQYLVVVVVVVVVWCVCVCVCLRAHVFGWVRVTMLQDLTILDVALYLRVSKLFPSKCF